MIGSWQIDVFWAESWNPLASFNGGDFFDSWCSPFFELVDYIGVGRGDLWYGLGVDRHTKLGKLFLKSFGRNK